jgi:hypothetical protein
MANITEIQVYYRDKQGNLQSVKQPPTAQDTDSIKMDVARMVKPIKESKTAEYYYVVVQVLKSDGQPGYRTIIPKTLL